MDSYLIVGLGNPGLEYEQTRHNIGFVALDQFSGLVGGMSFSRKWQGVYCKVQWHGNRLFLLKPETYMNKSGECLSRFKDYFKIPLGQLIVIHDDLDLPLGRVKISAKGGPGGHNGVRSIINHLGTSTFIRIKVGIGRPSKENNRHTQPVDRYVLSVFPPEQLDIINDSIDLVGKAIELTITSGVDAAMNTINTSKEK